jgi:hypothetical protein
MPTNLLTEAIWLVPIVAVGASVASIIRSVVSLCKKVVEERSRTARFTMALKDSTPRQRAEIIVACGQLEGR